MPDYPTPAHSASTPARPTLDEQANRLFRAAQLARQLEEWTDEIDGYLEDARLNDRNWSYYREYIDGARGMEMMLRYLGCDDNAHRFESVEEARAYLQANGWTTDPEAAPDGGAA